MPEEHRIEDLISDVPLRTRTRWLENELVARARQSVRPLITALHDPDPEMRAGAADVLGRIGAVSSIRPLSELVGDEDPWVRARAAAALGMIPHVRSVDALIEALSHPDPTVRWYAAEGLAHNPSPRSVPHLIRVLDDANLQVRTHAARALRRSGAPEAQTALKQAICRHVDQLSSETERERLHAIWALTLIGNPSVVEPLLEHLRSGSPQTRRAASAALSVIPGGSRARTRWRRRSGAGG